MTVASVLRISASTAVIQVSTAPSTGTTLRNEKPSPSLDVIPTMLLLPRPNLSAAEHKKIRSVQWSQCLHASGLFRQPTDLWVLSKALSWGAVDQSDFDVVP